MSGELLSIAQNQKGFEIKSMTVADLVNSIKKALILKQLEMKEYGISIKNVELTLKTVAIGDGGANMSLQIPILGKIALGSKISEKSMQTISLTLKPSKEMKLEREIELNEMEKTITQSISSIIGGVKNAINQDSIPMELEEASFIFNFILTGDNRISMIIESGLESELSNTIKISLEKLVDKLSLLI